jgi:hypothetical protein
MCATVALSDKVRSGQQGRYLLLAVADGRAQERIAPPLRSLTGNCLRSQSSRS